MGRRLVHGRMKSFMRTTWKQICDTIRISPSPSNAVSLRDKAIAVAGRVSVKIDRGCSKVTCPVCLTMLQSKAETDLKMTLAVHLSLWHPEDVKLQWDIMHRKRQSIVHLPSLILGVGVAVGFGALVARQLPKRGR